LRAATVATAIDAPSARRWREAIAVALLVFAGMVSGQSSVVPPAVTPVAPSAQAADLFDFWVGDWDLHWTNADGSSGRGRNRIDKILDGAVIEENFAEVGDADGAVLKGRSLTVFNKATGTWRQAWADNQGGFFALTGQVEGDRRILMTDVVRSADKASAQRMVFHSISANALTWDWEGSADGGSTWKRLWRIEYTRRRGP
jgi:hypothetical protein